MNHPRLMIEDLLKSLSLIEEKAAKAEPALSRLFAGNDAQQLFYTWLGRVSSSLEAAGMDEELGIWQATLDGGVPISSFDSSLSVQISSFRAILLGFREKLDRAGPSGPLFPMELVEGTRDYIVKIAKQANGCYQRGWYDACAVMLRRLIETLIIECFEQHGIAAKITDSKGNYFFLGGLITAFLAEGAWHIPRNMRNNLPKLKTIGDASAHSRYFVAKEGDVEKIAEPIRFTIQSLVYIAKF